MSQNEMVYDLGEIALEETRSTGGVTKEPDRPRSAAPTAPRGGTTRTSAAASSTDPRLSASLSLFVPGLGQLLSGDASRGLFFLAGIGLCGALLRAIVLTSDSLLRTLSLLGLGPRSVALSAAVLFSGAAVLHVVNVLHAARHGLPRGSRLAPHPVAAGVASLVVPGWGQILNGHGVRAGFFLVSAWLTAGAWIAALPATAGPLASWGVAYAVSLRDVGPMILVTAPAVLWTLAVYDAVAGAVAERRGRA